MPQNGQLDVILRKNDEGEETAVWEADGWKKKGPGEKKMKRNDRGYYGEDGFAAEQEFLEGLQEHDFCSGVFV